MNLSEIKNAVNQGKTVHWSNDAYQVTKALVKGVEYWYLVCNINQYTIGLTHQDNVTMNGNEKDFYISE